MYSDDARRYFTEDLELNWPRISRSRESRDYVSSMKPLDYLCYRSKSPMNEDFYHFVRKLLRFDPRERLTAAEALDDPFLK